MQQLRGTINGNQITLEQSPDLPPGSVVTVTIGSAPTLDAYITYRNPDAVAAYLAERPDIMPFLQTAWPALVESFGGPVKLVFEVMTYSAYEPSWTELVAWIQSSDEVEVALDKLEAFEDAFYLDHMIDDFGFTLEMQ